MKTFLVTSCGSTSHLAAVMYRCTKDTVTSLLGVVRVETGLKLSTREGSKTLPFNLVLSYSLS